MQFNTIIRFCHVIKLLKLKINYSFEKLKYKCKEMDTCFLCNVDVPPKSRVYFKNMAEETYGVHQRDPCREIQYSDKQIVEVLQKEQVACRGKCNMISKNLTKLKNSFYYSFYL